MDHFLHPRNMGELPEANGVATVGNPQCGDVMRMFVKISEKDNQEFIEDIKFQTLGCAAAISTSSIATEMIKGKTLKEALSLTNKAVAKALGGLPSSKYHCSVLAEQAVRKVINNYLENKTKNVSETSK